jgi:uncharacterized protein YegL
VRGCILSDRLGGAVGRKPLHFLLVLDVSGSMQHGGRIQALNNAVKEVAPRLREEARANPHAELLIRVLAFASTARWVVDEPTPIEKFRWRGVDAVPQGLTELGLALRELASVMRDLDDEPRGYPPAIVLVSDGRPTHTARPNFPDGLQELLNERWGRAAVRLALGVGKDADMHALRRFVGREDVPLPRADNPQQLVDLIVWASKAASKSAVLPSLGQPGVNYHIPRTTGDPIWARTQS